jgi:ABC-type sulfate/molybdate transport systems ATPase subunit
MTMADRIVVLNAGNIEQYEPRRTNARASYLADLDAAARQMVFDKSFITCVLEAGLDRDAYSTVVRDEAAATARR